MSEQSNNPMPEPTALELATTDELVNELRKRSDAIVIGMVTKAGGGCWSVYTAGHTLSLLGLASELHRTVREKAKGVPSV